MEVARRRGPQAGEEGRCARVALRVVEEDARLAPVRHLRLLVEGHSDDAVRAVRGVREEHALRIRVETGTACGKVAGGVEHEEIPLIEVRRPPDVDEDAVARLRECVFGEVERQRVDVA